jgi:hypothetical protein
VGAPCTYMVFSGLECEGDPPLECRRCDCSNY